MPPQHDEAICIRHWDWSETSQTVSLLTHNLGLVRALAKGSRRPNAPYSGGIELLTRAEAGLILRPNADLALLTEWNLHETFPPLRTSLRAYHAGLYMAELVQRMVSDHDPHPDLYEILLEALRTVEAPDALLKFQWGLLTAVGYAPVIDRDVQSAAPLGRHEVVKFVPELGGISTSPEKPSTTTGRPFEAWSTRATTLRALTRPEKAEAAEITRATRLLAAYIRFLIGYEPLTLRMVFPQLSGTNPGQGGRSLK